MDIQQYASHPSDPLWEEPGWHKRHVHVVNFHHTCHHDDDDVNGNAGSVGGQELAGPESPRREALDEAAAKLNFLCASDAPLADVQDFLAKWEDPSSTGRVQPNALAWFNDTYAVQSACLNDNQVVLRTLLEKGLRPTTRAAALARKKWQETKNKDVLQLLVDYGLDINQPLDHDTPPIMRLVFV